MSTSSSKHNLAARMAVWSGRHRKKAIAQIAAFPATGTTPSPAALATGLSPA